MGWRFPGIGPPLPFWPLMVGHRTPWHWWACHSAYANILQWEFNEAQVYWKSTPLLSWTWLVLTSFCHVLQLCHTFKVVPCPLPSCFKLIGDSGWKRNVPAFYTLGEWFWSCLVYRVPERFWVPTVVTDPVQYLRRVWLPPHGLQHASSTSLTDSSLLARVALPTSPS